MWTFISPVSGSFAPVKDNHLLNMNKPVMAKTNMRSIEKVRVKRNGIIIVQRINIKTLPKIGRDCQMMVICRCFSKISRDTLEKAN